MPFQCAATLFQEELESGTNKVIVTFCQALDNILGGGIQTGSITEVAGVSGSGKTQLAFQLCVDVQIPVELGGLAGDAVYIDTESVFSTSRISEIASYVVRHCHHISKSKSKTKSLTVNSFLSKIFYFKCLNPIELLACTHQMTKFLKTHKNVRLLVVDSVAQCVRAEEDMRGRNRLLNILATNFRQIAFHHDIAVVLINQVTNRINDDGTSLTVAALGETWSHVAATKLMLMKQQNKRMALLYKSSSRPRGIAYYGITKDGFRDEQQQGRVKHFNEFKYLETEDNFSRSPTITQLGIDQEYLQLSQQLLLPTEDIITEDEYFSQQYAQDLDAPKSELKETTHLQVHEKAGEDNPNKLFIETPTTSKHGEEELVAFNRKFSDSDSDEMPLTQINNDNDQSPTLSNAYTKLPIKFVHSSKEMPNSVNSYNRKEGNSAQTISKPPSPVLTPFKPKRRKKHKF